MQVDGIATNLPLHRRIVHGRRLRRRRRRHPPSRTLAAASGARREHRRTTPAHQPARHDARCCSRRRAHRPGDAAAHLGAGARGAAMARGARSRAGHEQPDADASPVRRDALACARGAAAGRLGRRPSRCRSKAASSNCPWSTAARAARTWPTWWPTPACSVDEIVELPQRAAVPGLCARQPPRLLLPRRHGPAHRDAAAQGAGAQHSGRRGVDRRRADRRVGLRRPERLEHHRQHRDGASSTRRGTRRRCCSPATASASGSRG